MTAKQLGGILRERRAQIGLCQTAAGGKARPFLLRKTVADIENGTGNPLLATVLAYAAALKCSLTIQASGRRPPNIPVRRGDSRPSRPR